MLKAVAATVKAYAPVGDVACVVAQEDLLVEADLS